MKEEKIFNLAKELNGEVSLTYLYAYSDLKLNDIEKTLGILESKNYLTTEINNEMGTVKYIFPNLVNKEISIKKENDITDKILNSLQTLFYRFREKNLETKLYSNLKNSSIKDPLLNFEKIILQLAYIKGGKLHIEDISEYIPLSIEEIESVLNSLNNKGLCKKEFQNNNLIYVFTDIITNRFYENDDFIEKIKKYYLSNVLNIPDKIKDVSKNKTLNYISNKKSKSIFNFLIPGYLLLRNRQVNSLEYFIYFILPLIISGGLSYIPQMFISRYQNLKYYSLSNDLFNKELPSTNKDSLLYSIIFIIMYYYFIGFEGLSNYYTFLLSVLF